jgi:hypothetical protein
MGIVMGRIGKSPDKKIFEKILTLMGFVKDRMGKHGEVWKHYAKNLVTQLPISPSGLSWVKNKKSELTKLITDNFSKEDIELFLAPLIKKRKVQFTNDGRVRLLRIEPKLNMKGFPLVEGGEPQQDLEEDLLYALLPPDEPDDVYEKVKKIIEEKRK